MRASASQLEGDVLEAPDPFLLVAARIDAPPAGAGEERAAVAPLEAPLRVVRLPGRGVLVGEPPGLAPVLLAGEQHRRGLPHQAARRRLHHFLEKAVAALDLPVAHEGDAHRGVVQDQFLLAHHAADFLVGALPLGDVLEQPDVALGDVAGLQRPAGAPAPEARAVLPLHPLVEGGRLAGLQFGDVAPHFLELLVGEVVLARRGAVGLARDIAEQLLEAPVAAHDLALAQERDADHHVVGDRLVLGKHALQFLLGALLLRDVLQQPHRSSHRIGGIHRAAGGALPEHGAVAAPGEHVVAVALAARHLRIAALGGFIVRVGRVSHRSGLAVELAGGEAVHFLEPAVAADDPAVADEADADRSGVEDRLLLAQQSRHLVGVALAVGDVLVDPDGALRRIPRIDRLGDHPREERRAVLAPHFPFHVQLPAADQQRDGDRAHRLVALARGIDHLALLADQLLRLPAEHLGELRVAQRELALPGEGDADGGIGEDRLVLELRVARAARVVGSRLFHARPRGDRSRLVHSGTHPAAHWRARAPKVSA